MNREHSLPLADQLAAAQDWWREAGVDMTFTDDPHGWLAEPEAEAAATASPPVLANGAARKRPEPEEARPQIGGDRANWPAELEAFRSWWLEDPALDEGGTHPRIAPRGAAGADIAVLIPMPEAGDRESLLSGRAGELVGNLLLAMGMAEDRAYLAAALPRHMAMPDWEGLARDGMGAVLLHHLTLARPKRLLVLGRGILPLLGHDPAQGPAVIQETAIQDLQVPTLAGVAPDRLLENARQRESLWRRWLDWTGTKE